MKGQQLDEDTILQVAREIRKPEIRATYLSQVCSDCEVQRRLEQRLKAHRRWQFGMRTLLVFVVLAGAVSGFLGLSVRTAYRARLEAERALLQALQAETQARAALERAEAARQASAE